MIRVVLADDEPTVRSAMSLILEQQRGLVVIDEVGAAPQLLEAMRQGCPGLVFLDWELPGLHHEVVLNDLRSTCPLVRIIALSSRPNVAAAALAEGCNAFVSKGDPPEVLLAAIACVIGS